VEQVEARRLLATFTVLNVADAGPNSLRQAILDANAASGLDDIRFSIPGPGPFTIIPQTALPTVSDPVIIDGTTQPGFAGRPIIELNGSASNVNFFFASGLTINAPGSTVRGLAINRFNGYGIELNNVDGGVIAGNFIGTDPLGVVDLGNGFGGITLFESRNVSIGGPTTAEGNVISGNNGVGINLSGFTGLPGGNTIQGNMIGTDRTGSRAIPNNGGGILVNASGNQIGGTGAGQANTIAFNGSSGVQVGFSFFFQRIEANPIRGNAIYGNGGLGIDLGGNGVTFNDPSDSDLGPNLFQNFPVIDAAYPSPGGTTIEGSLISRPNSTFSIDFYLNDAPDPSGYGEGQRYFGTRTITTNASGLADLNFEIPGGAAPGLVITATATDRSNNTSEFSLERSVTPGPLADLTLSLSDAPDPAQVGQALTYTVTVTNNGPTRARQVTVTDVLPTGVTFVSTTPSQGIATVAGGVLNANLGDLRIGQTATLQVVVRPTGIGTLSNTVTVRSAETDPEPQDNTATVTTTVNPALPADLAISKVDLPDQVRVDRELTYRLYISNNGPGDAVGVVVTDELPQGVEFVSASSSLGTVTQSGGTLTANIDTLAAGQSMQVTIVVRPLVIGTLLNTAAVVGSQPDFQPGNDITTIETRVVAEATPPTILAQRLTVTRSGITGIVLTFSEPLDADLAEAPNNYGLRSAGRDGVVGSADDSMVAFSSIRYDAGRRTVTLTPSRPLKLGVFYQVTVNGVGAPGVTDTAGNVLDGDRNGLPDGIYESQIGRGTHVRPTRFQRDQVIPLPGPIRRRRPQPQPGSQPRPSHSSFSETILNLSRVKRRESRA
jgi:uncharacterized repeat protein (TIGR01451 family)